jgi:hypothetical protein
MAASDKHFMMENIPSLTGKKDPSLISAAGTIENRAGELKGLCPTYIF